MLTLKIIIMQLALYILPYNLCLGNTNLGLPLWPSGKNLPANEGAMGSVPGLGRFHGEEHGNLLQYSCQENYMDREAWWTTVHGGLKIVRYSLATKQQQNTDLQLN